jgi:nifR3 family TIM-barrel protein
MDMTCDLVREADPTSAATAVRELSDAAQRARTQFHGADGAPPPTLGRGVAHAAAYAALMASRPVMLAPMEDVSDPAFRAICREYGADLCFTEFVNVDGLLNGDFRCWRKLQAAPEDRPLGIQIYGSNPEKLVEAARLVAEIEPLIIDINCGCWVPKIAKRGAGAGWLRDLPAMEAMVRAVARAVDLPVTVKTRIGWGDGEPPVPELVRRLEDAGAAGITLHCRTALQRHEGMADWTWAALARELVRVPVTVNGGIVNAEDVPRALAETGCAGAMVARGAVGNPWIFRQAHEVLAGHPVTPPTVEERLAVCRRHFARSVALRNERAGICAVRRHLPGYLSGLPHGVELRRQLHERFTLEGCLEVLDQYQERLASVAAV